MSFLLVLAAIASLLFLGYLWGLSTVLNELDSREFRRSIEVIDQAQAAQRAIQAINRTAFERIADYASQYRYR